MNNDDHSMQSKGGKARAKKLTPEQRSSIAKIAAESRWQTEGVLRASHDGDLDLAGRPIRAAVLPNGKRLLTQGTLLQAIGRSRTPKAGTGGAATVDGLPFFLQAEQLQPFISEELRASTTPIFFRLKDGQRAVGYDAQLLPMICEVYLKFRDACQSQGKAPPRQYLHIVEACDLLMRALARVGIVALVDEATGYQEIRDRQALAEILKKYIDGELYKWTETFPIALYKEIFRLKGWAWNNGKMPQVVGHYTNDLVYDRLTKGMLEELRRLNPKDVATGRRKHRNYQFLTPEVGYPALNQRLHTLVGMAMVSETWDQFYRAVDRRFPRMNDTPSLPFSEDV